MVPQSEEMNRPLPPGPCSPMAHADSIVARRADIDSKQQLVADVLAAMNCEAALLLMPAHVAWFTAGLTVRGLIADSERPGIFTNGRQRWLLCSNIDTQRFFDEEIDQLGFQLKEWAWYGGRSELLANITAGRTVAADRPFPNIPLINDRLRPFVRVLTPYEQQRYCELGRWVAHAVEATARTLRRGETEEEIAGQLGHRLLHHGIHPAVLSVTADDRAVKFRRTGFSTAAVTRSCVVQATGEWEGLFVTAARTVCFGPPPDDFRLAHDAAVKLAAVYRSYTEPGATIASVADVASLLLANTPLEFDGRMSQPGYGAGRFPAEELRRAGRDEPFSPGQAILWQPRLGAAASVDTLLVTDTGCVAVTPPLEWPFKRITVRGVTTDIPDLLIRTDE